jgi:hypothetical protein
MVESSLMVGFGITRQLEFKKDWKNVSSVSPPEIAHFKTRPEITQFILCYSCKYTHLFASWKWMQYIWCANQHVGKSANINIIIIIVLMMEAVNTSETSVYFNRATQYFISEGCHLHIHHKPKIPLILYCSCPNILIQNMTKLQ